MHVSKPALQKSAFLDGTGTGADAGTAGRGRWSLKRLSIGAGAALLIAAAAGYGTYYWRTGRFLVSTDDAYVQAHSVLISPKVSGYLAEAPVDDNQPVKVGTVLARIDPRDYQTALVASPDVV